VTALGSRQRRGDRQNGEEYEEKRANGGSDHGRESVGRKDCVGVCTSKSETVVDGEKERLGAKFGLLKRSEPWFEITT